MNKMPEKSNDTIGIIERSFFDKRPILLVLVGLPGSGKSRFCKYQQGFAVHSSDSLRKELYGNESIQCNNEELFKILHSRIKQDLLAGWNVIYDATNINKKKRAAFLDELKHIPCQKKCVVFMTPYELCLKQNQNRERVVPDRVIWNMYLRWSPPDYSEGFDDILIVYNYGDSVNRMKYSVTYFFEGEEGADNMDQGNSHHALTLGQHCRKAADYLAKKYESDQTMYVAGLLHDVGKFYTKTNINARGFDDGNCHYYNHENVSSYLSFFFTDVMGMKKDDQIAVANMIFYHMRPYLSWMQSSKARDKDVRRIGEEMYLKIMALHEADLYAH